MNWINLVPRFIKEEILNEEYRLRSKDNNKPTRGFIRIKEIGEDGALLREQKFNLIVNGMKTALSHCIAGDSTSYHVNGFKVGTGTTAPTVGDADLEVSQVSKNEVVASYPTSTSVLFTLTLDNGEGNGNAFTEAGLFADFNGTPFMTSRVVFNPINKDSSIKLIFEWEYIF